MGETAEDLILLQTVGHRHLDGAVKGELATVDARQHLEGLLADILALEQLRPERRPGRLDLPGQPDLLGAGEEGDLSHLRQIHPDRIIGPVLPLIDEDILGFTGRLGLRLDLAVDVAVGKPSGIVIGEHVDVGILGIDDLDRQVLDILGIGDDIVFEFVQQRVVQGGSSFGERIHWAGSIGPVNRRERRRAFPAARLEASRRRS